MKPPFAAGANHRVPHRGVGGGNGFRPPGLRRPDVAQRRGPMTQPRPATAGATENKSVAKQPFAAPAGVIKKADVLPVQEARHNVVQLIQKNQVCVIVGETGSGKSTLIPQFVLDDIVRRGNSGGNGEGGGSVVCTQPRRVAAITIAQYVAHCRGAKVGEEVGYAVRFDEAVSSKTRLKFATDGILLRELLVDPQLRKYQCVLLDEAHERTLHGDVLFGLLKQLAKRRPDIRIVIMSATLNAEQFSKFWNNAPIGYIAGRTFPVEVSYAQEPQVDYVDAAINTIIQVHLEEALPGDILCFLTGQDEIEDVKRVLEERRKLLPREAADYLVRTLYAAMNPQAQLEAFAPAPSNTRKIVLATNIAETSITIDGIVYVIDTGVVKSREYNPDTSMDSLLVRPESRAQARQRSGRAGRVSAGKCFRLYTEEAFEVDMTENTVPEILRCNLSAVVLQMLEMGIREILKFDFMDPPSQIALIRSLQQLMSLGAVEATNQGPAVTRVGHQMVALPVDPMAARAIVKAIDLGVAPDVCAIIAMLSSDSSVFSSGRASGDGETQDPRSKFAKTTGDHITLLHVFEGYRKIPVKERAHWCEGAGINAKQMARVLDVFLQLMQIISSHDAFQSADDADATSSSVAKRHRAEIRQHAQTKGVGSLVNVKLNTLDGQRDYELVRTALTFGYFLNSAYLDSNGQYLTIVNRTPVVVHPSSVLFHSKRKPSCVIFNSVITTSKQYMREVVSIRDEWLQAACPKLFRGAGAPAVASNPTQ